MNFLTFLGLWGGHTVAERAISQLQIQKRIATW